MSSTFYRKRRKLLAGSILAGALVYWLVSCYSVLLSQTLSPTYCTASADKQAQQLPSPTAISKNSQPVHNDAIPRSVHVVLNDTFGFRHYLVVKSILRHVTPTILYIHVSSLSTSIPAEFRNRIHNEYPNIELIRRPTTGNISFNDIRNLLNESRKGGIYFSFDTLVQPPIHDLLRADKCFVDTNMHIVILHAGCHNGTDPTQLEAIKQPLVSSHPSDTAANGIILSSKIYDRLKPFETENALTNNDQHWNALVWRANCDCDQLDPVRHAQPVIPNLVHYIWFSSTPWRMTFMQLISLLSNLKINHANQVYIHSNTDPVGPHWQWLRDRYEHKIVLRFYPQPKYIHGKALDPKWVAHSADIARLIILQQYGGMYFDWDAIALKPHEEFRYYDGVMGFNRPWNFGLSNGHMMFSGNSEFLRLYKNNYANFNPRSWSDTSVSAPKEIYLRHPYLLKIPDRFMKSQYNEELKRTFSTRGSFNMSDYFAFHYSHPEPEDYFQFELNFSSVAQMQSLFGTILRHVINCSQQTRVDRRDHK